MLQSRRDVAPTLVPQSPSGVGATQGFPIWMSGSHRKYTTYSLELKKFSIRRRFRGGLNHSTACLSRPTRLALCCIVDLSHTSATVVSQDHKFCTGNAGFPFYVLDERGETSDDDVSVSTMHLAKGLEFRAVAVMACDDEVIPLQERIETVADDADLEEVYDTERHLLYVACTRARDHLMITSVAPASEFLEDLQR